MIIPSCIKQDIEFLDSEILRYCKKLQDIPENSLRNLVKRALYRKKIEKIRVLKDKIILVVRLQNIDTNDLLSIFRQYQEVMEISNEYD